MFSIISPRTRTFVVMLALSLMSHPALAGTIVEVQTSLGNFYVEVDEQVAPLTAGNFLEYVRSGRYNNTFVHGATGGSIIRGGGYNYNDCNVGPEEIPTDAAIPLENTGLAHTDGSIAALHPSTEIDGATSQWFINLGNDPSLDDLNGGYAVFGRVLGNGTEVVNAISIAHPVRLANFFLETPTVNYFEEVFSCQNFSRDNLVQVLMSVIEDDSDNAVPSANFNSVTGTLDINLDLGAEGFTHLSFTVEQTAALVSVRANLESAFDLQMPRPNMANFNPISGELVIPSIAVDGTILYRNVILDLQDLITASFVLRSFD